ncbi:MAG: RagB/SusD family nutrient uptake outer membrane protein [Prevotella sp.]|nr:RagB/SusD family nutrient uptake outer membrane protein [Prevotella sp.]
MKTKNILIAGLVASTALAMTSCGSDYLETSPSESVSTGQAVGSTTNAYKALNGIAKTMSTQQYAWSQGCAGEDRIISLYENYPSQDYIYNYYAAGWGPIMNIQYNTRNNTSYAAYPWYYYYTIIGQANSIICNINNATGPESEKNFDKASALTYRAYGYEKLLHYYCPRWKESGNGSAEGLPLRVDESTGDLAPSTMAEVYQQIYKDCEDAIALFQSSDFNRSSSEIWIANENVAHAVYARAALTREDYSTALAQAKLARQGYPLMSNAEYQSGFCKPTSEWIFGSYGDATENLWYWSYGTQYSCNGYYANNTPCGGGAMYKGLYDQIPNNDARKALFITEDKFPEFDIYNKANVNQTYAFVSGKDMRDAVYSYINRLWASSGVSSMAMPYQAGYFYLGGQMKFYVFDTPGVGYLPFIRSSEMVLIEAEANYFLGNASAAQASLVELNATSGRNPEYTCTLTGDALWNEIMNYRCFELWGEGFGYSDYKRWGRAISRKTLANGGNAHAAIAIDIPASASNSWIWAVPQHETDYNKGYSTGNETME